MQRSDVDVPSNSSMAVPSANSSEANHLLMRKQLALLLHANRCRRRIMIERLPDGCTTKHCSVMRQLLSHMERCVDGANCTVYHCRSSKLILGHFRMCKSRLCDICSAVRQPDIKPEEPGVNHYNPPEFRNGPSTEATTSESKPPEVNGIKSSPPQAPQCDSIAPCTSFTVNGEVHRSNRNSFHLSDQQRELAMKKFVYGALSTANSTAYNDPRMKQFLDHVKRMEKNIFMKSKSAEEYYTALTAYYQSIHSELKEKRRLRGNRPPDAQSEQNDLVSIQNQLQNSEKSDECSYTSQTENTIENNSADMHVQRQSCSASSVTAVDSRVHTTTESEQCPVKEEADMKANDSLPIKEDKPDSSEDVKPSERPKPEPDSQSTTPRDATSRAIWYPNDLLRHFLPVVERISKEKDAEPFLQPVDWEALEIYDYPQIVTNPMDLSTIRKKLEDREYKDPWSVVDDFWLMLNNAWLYNKKTSKVYKTCTRLAEIFEAAIDPVMQSLGFCCGREYYYQPPPLTCLTPKFCTIHRDAVYYVYNNENHIPGLLEQKYTVCERCYNEAGDEIRLDSESPTVVMVQKSLMEKCKNDRKEKEPFVFCRKCGRKWHRVCAIHMDEIWPEGFTCSRCIKDNGLRRTENRFTARRLATCKLSNFLEKRVNDFLKKKGVTTGDVIIRVLAAADKSVDVKPGMRSKFCETGEMPESFPYRVKAIFAFQEIDGHEVCFFGLHVQEYGSECPFPNTRRVYLAYLDSVYFFRPKEYRTDIYHEILVGYINYAKLLGFSVAHIWACPPSEGDDYIFHMHPADQKIPKPKRLQEWYQKMLKKALLERIVVDYKDICQDACESRLVSPTELAYFEGDFWPNTLEELFKEMDEEDARRKREQEALARDDDEDEVKENVQTTETESHNPGKKKAKKRKLKRNSSLSLTGKRKRLGGGNCADFANEVARRVYEIMEKHKENFFVIRLHPQNMIASLPPIKDPDPLISSDLMECRGAFLERAREKHLEFSTLRRAKYSTLVMLYELHTENRQPLMYTCNVCNIQLETPWQCKQCVEYDLCPRCYETERHPHPMVQVGLGLDDGSKGSDADSEAAAVQESGRDKLIRFVKALGHGCSCRDANCRVVACKTMKSNVQHFRAHAAAARNQCQICRSLKFLCYYHSKTCHELKCPVPLCPKLKAKMKQQQKQQRLEQTQMLRRRMATMQRYNSMTPTQQPGGTASSSSSSQPGHQQHPTSVSSDYVVSPVSSSAQSSPYPNPAVGGTSFAPMASPMSRTPASLPSPQQPPGAYAQMGPGCMSQQAYSKALPPGSTVISSPNLTSPQPMGYGPHSSPIPYNMPQQHPHNAYGEPMETMRPEHNIGAPTGYGPGPTMSRSQSMLNTTGGPLPVGQHPHSMERVHSAHFAQMTAPQLNRHGSLPPHSPRSQQQQQQVYFSQHGTDPNSSYGPPPTVFQTPAQLDDQVPTYPHSKQQQQQPRYVTQPNDHPPSLSQNPNLPGWRPSSMPNPFPNSGQLPSRGPTSPCTPNVTVARQLSAAGSSAALGGCATPPVGPISVSAEDVHTVKQAYSELRQRGAPFSEFSNLLNANPHLFRAWQFIQQSHMYAQQQQQQQQQQQASFGPSHPNFPSHQQQQMQTSTQPMLPSANSRSIRQSIPQWSSGPQAPSAQQQLRSRPNPVPPNQSQFFYPQSNRMAAPQSQMVPNPRYVHPSGGPQSISPQAHLSLSPPPMPQQRSGTLPGPSQQQQQQMMMSRTGGMLPTTGSAVPVRSNHPGMHSSIMLSQLLGPNGGAAPAAGGGTVTTISSQYPVNNNNNNGGGGSHNFAQQMSQNNRMSDQPPPPGHYPDPNNIM